MNNEFETEALAYSIMKNYGRFEVVHNGEKTVYVGELSYSDKLILRRDFFNRSEANLFRDNNGEFITNNITWEKERGCIKVERNDGILEVFCLEPHKNEFAEFEIDSIWDLCNPKIADDYESCVINGIHYNVTNPARISPTVMTSSMYSEICCLIDACLFENITLKFYYVRDFQTRKFYLGLWDCDKHCPISYDTKGIGNSDYSSIYDILFPA